MSEPCQAATEIPESQRNLAKHGIDFDSAQELWEDASLLEVPSRTVDEPRSLVVGRIGVTHWSAIITYGGDRTRIISVRRSRKDEMELYES